MSKKYIGFVHGKEIVPFPSPAAPTYGYGKKYCVLVEDGEVYYLFKDGTKTEAESLSPLSVKQSIDRGEWAAFDHPPFLHLNRGNRPSTTPYGGHP